MLGAVMGLFVRVRGRRTLRLRAASHTWMQVQFPFDGVIAKCPQLNERSEAVTFAADP